MVDVGSRQLYQSGQAGGVISLLQVGQARRVKGDVDAAPADRII
ncbi:hypothetical protein [Streptomyces griseofuscus]|nr:hypothetical protein [Streptomyces griseofuscus]